MGQNRAGRISSVGNMKPPPEPQAITLLLHNGGLRAKTRQDSPNKPPIPVANHRDMISAPDAVHGEVARSVLYPKPLRIKRGSRTHGRTGRESMILPARCHVAQSVAPHETRVRALRAGLRCRQRLRRSAATARKERTFHSGHDHRHRYKYSRNSIYEVEGERKGARAGMRTTRRTARS